MTYSRSLMRKIRIRLDMFLQVFYFFEKLVPVGDDSSFRLASFIMKNIKFYNIHKENNPKED